MISPAVDGIDDAVGIDDRPSAFFSLRIECTNLGHQTDQPKGYKTNKKNYNNKPSKLKRTLAHIAQTYIMYNADYIKMLSALLGIALIVAFWCILMHLAAVISAANEHIRMRL